MHGSGPHLHLHNQQLSLCGTAVRKLAGLGVQALLEHGQGQLPPNCGARVITGDIDEVHLQVLQRGPALLQLLLDRAQLALDPAEEGTVVLVIVQLPPHILHTPFTFDWLACFTCQIISMAVQASLLDTVI